MTFRSSLRNLFPAWFRAVTRNIKVLEIDYNHFQSAYQKKCITRGGSPIPWYTYPAIEYLSQLDFSEKVIFEYGCGYSTLFWSGRAKEVKCVEDNAAWADFIRSHRSPNVEIRFTNSKEEYVSEISRYAINFDVIVIDGEHYRLKCAQIAPTLLNPGGLIILDNSDHYFRTAQILREANLLQVDMTGFGPIQGCTWTTSLFFDRAFNFRPVDNIQPHPGIGSADSSEQERLIHEGEI